MLSKKDQKFIKSLKVKKYRTREECFLVEGAKNVLELIASDFETTLIVGTESFFSKYQIPGNIRVEEVKSNVLESLGTFKTNQDVIGIAKVKYWKLTSLNKNDHVFVLDGVGDPGNVGTIIRTLDWFGFDQLVCSNDCADFYNPKTINSTMGSFTRMKVFEVDLNTFYEQNRNPIFGADMYGESLFEHNIKSHSVFVLGSESNGISELSRKAISNYLSIPRFGKAESLNVGIAAGIIASYLRMP